MAHGAVNDARRVGWVAPESPQPAGERVEEALQHRCHRSTLAPIWDVANRLVVVYGSVSYVR
jgi:hypothetical protein